MKRFSMTLALAWLLGAAGAHAAPTPADASDPHAAVPATVYRPAVDYQAAPATATSPDRAWRDANATVGGRNAMRLTMPGVEGTHAHEEAHEEAHDGTPAEQEKAIPLHGHHAGTHMQAMQCAAGKGDGKTGGKGCCAGMHGAGHASHGGGATGMQCMADGACACCAGNDETGGHANHAGHADMAMKDGAHGCCCGHGAAPGQPAACGTGSRCACCGHGEAT